MVLSKKSSSEPSARFPVLSCALRLAGGHLPFIWSVLEAQRSDGLVALDLQLLVDTDLDFDITQQRLLLGYLQLQQVVALRQFQELERVRAVHLGLEVIRHELYFLELASKFKSVGLEDAGLLLYDFIEFF